MSEKKQKGGAGVSRRDTIKLATAVGALGAGLGVFLEADDASADTKLKTDAIGNFVIKFYKLDGEGKGSSLLHTVDLGSFSIKFMKSGAYSVKLFNQKGGASAPADIIVEQALQLEEPPK